MSIRRPFAIALVLFLAIQPAWAFDFETLPVPTDEVFSLVFAPDGKGIYMGDDDGNIRLWDLSSGGVSVHVKTALPHGATTSRNLVRVTSDGRHALTAYASGNIRYLDLATGENIWNIKFFSDQLLCLALSPDGKLGLASDLSTRLVLFRTQDGGIVWDFKHNGIVDDVAFSASGELIFEAETSQFRAETLEGYLADFDFQVPGLGWAGFHDIEVAKTGVVAAAAFGEVHLYDGRNGKRLRVHKIKGELSARIVAISPDGKRFLTKLENGQAGLFDARSGKQLGAVGVTEEFSDIKAMAFSPDGSRFAIADNDGRISLWRTKGLKQVASARIWSDGYVVFLPDGTFMTVAGAMATLLEGDGFDPSKADPVKVKSAFAK
jgi:WD40 repeat protein